MEQKRMTRRLLFISWVGLLGQITIVLYSLLQSFVGPPYSTICLFASISLPLVFWLGYGFAVGKGSRSIQVGALACGIFLIARLVLRALIIFSAYRSDDFWVRLYFQLIIIDSWAISIISMFGIVFLVKFASNSVMPIKVSSVLYILVLFASFFYYFITPVMPGYSSSAYIFRIAFALLAVPFYVSMISYQRKHFRSLNL